MMYMIIENYKRGCAQEIYRRAMEKGRMLPDGVRYIDSWVTVDLNKCFQLMECEKETQLHEWMNHWNDLVDFEFTEVLTSDQAAKAVLEES